MQKSNRYFTYIIFSPTLDRHYIGQTGDPVARFQKHLAGSTRATGGRDDWCLIFLQAFDTRQNAMVLEQKIKRAKSRSSMRRYIEDRRNQIAEPMTLQSIVSGGVQLLFDLSTTP